MPDIDSSLQDSQLLLDNVYYPLIDTHTHFDEPVFDSDRATQAHQAYACGIRHVILVGYLYHHFSRLYKVQRSINSLAESVTTDMPAQMNAYPNAHVTLGLHPFYIEQHTDAHLFDMEQLIIERRPIAIGEIGLDTYTNAMRQPEVFEKQQRFFKAQLDIAVRYQLPVMLHIRKAHAEALAILKAHSYDAHKLGGIAHSFSGGVQEAKAFVKLGFKLGVTGQITNPNAKKLRKAIHAAVESYGIECLVIETDCPDMMPIMGQITNTSPLIRKNQSTLNQSLANEVQSVENRSNRNVPANLVWTLECLSEILEIDRAILAHQLWQNSCKALHVSWSYSLSD